MKSEDKKKFLDLLPSDFELATLSKRIAQTVTSKGELLNLISTLSLEKLELEDKMIYALGLMSLGFDQERAIDRLGVRKSEFFIWSQNPEHETLLRQSVARGEMILEEMVLGSAENDPKLAFKMLELKEKKKLKKAEAVKEKEDDIWKVMRESAKGRGVVIEGEIVQDVLE